MKFWPAIQTAADPQAPERYRTYLQLMKIAQKIEDRGWLIDPAAAREHASNAVSRAAKFRRIFLERTGLDPKVLGNSGEGQTPAMRKYFWETMGAPHVVFNKKSKDKKNPTPQLNGEALMIYATDYKNTPYAAPAAALYAIRKNLRNASYAQAYLKVAAANKGRIHFKFNPTGTKGERWSAGGSFEVPGEAKHISLNAQQIPSKEPQFDFKDGTLDKRLVHSLRNIFVADPGCALIKADFDQLELRLIAYTAGARTILLWIDTGADTHMENAVVMFGPEMGLRPGQKKVKKPKTDFEFVVANARDGAKGGIYGFSYQMPSGRGNDKYVQQYKQLKKLFPDIEEAYVNVIAKRLFKVHPEIRDWQFATGRALEDNGTVVLTVNGATLYLPPSMRGKNQALNFQMQSTGGYLINRALIEVDARLDWEAQEHIRAMVHDEIVGHAPIRAVERVGRIIEEAMGRPAQIGATFAGIPAGADPGFNWRDVKALDQFLEEVLGDPRD